MNVEELKYKYIGKKLKVVMQVENINEHSDNFKKIIGSTYEKIETIHILFFENKQYIAFVDFDCDGYRSGSWHVVDIADWTDTGDTKEIKKIDSIVTNIEYFEQNSEEFLLITTDEYLIKMGQNSIDDYYPSNFINIDEAKHHAMGELVELKE